jgi:hypothetical protein
MARQVVAILAFPTGAGQQADEQADHPLLLAVRSKQLMLNEGATLPNEPGLDAEAAP